MSGLQPDGTLSTTFTIGGTNNTYSGGTTISGGNLLVAADGSLGLTSGAITFGTVNGGFGTLQPSNGDLVLASARGVILNAGVTGTIDPSGSNVTVNGVISGTGSLSNGGGTLILAGANTFSGAMNVVGNLTLNNTSALQSATANITSGSIAFAPSIGTFTFGGLSGNGNLALTDSNSAALTLRVGNNNANSTFSGGMSGSGSNLTKIGTGNLTLTGSNSYSGVTTINQGVLTLGTAGAITSTSQVVLSGGRLSTGGNTQPMTSTTLKLTANSTLDFRKQ